jgi:adenylate kinase family enzyme
MISLLHIINESLKQKPKALILAGAPAAGKGSVLNGLNLEIKTLNLDDIIADLSKKQGFTLNQKNADKEDRSKFMQAMHFASKKLKTELLPSILKNKESFILDGTSASVKNTLELKNELEKLGYEVMMLYIYADLETILDRNENRYEKSKGQDRSLIPSALLGTWNNVTRNFSIFQKEFNNFVSVATSGKDESLKDLKKIQSKYIDPYKVLNGREKTEKEIEREKKQKEKLNNEIEQLLNSSYIKNIINSSISKEEAKQKIKIFFNI